MPKRVGAERTTATFVDHASRFHVKPSKALTQQFASLYYTRLNELRAPVEAVASKRWGADILNACVKTLDAEPGATAFIVGTIYCDMKAKPSIVDEASRDILDTSADPSRSRGKYCSEGDTILLEDEYGRLALRLPPALAQEIFVTGAVVGVKGTVSEGGELEVEDVCLPGLPPQAQLGAARVQAAPSAAPRYVALVSGLRVGHDAYDMLPLQMLAEHLTGQLGCDEDHRLQASIVRLVIAGNATGCPVAGEPDSALGVAGSDILKKMAAPEQRSLAQHVRSLDQFLTTVSAAMPVDLVPGPDDPCNFLLPQQPFHPCMLPQSSQLSSLNLSTNPYCCDVDGVRLLGTAGQPVDDMQRYLPGDDRLASLTRLLEFRHLAPTAPDTLGCYPYAEEAEDPFVMRECPHIFFAGNQPRFETTLVEGPAGERVRAILVPDFSVERTCVLVDLDSLECRPLSFAGL